jgi:nitrite reductase (NO-forming)
VSAGGATVVEFTPKLPGTYSIVDHSLGRMQKGAAGQIVVEGADHPEIFQSIQAGSGGSGGHETFGRQAALGSESPSAERLSTEWPRNAATETPRHAEVFGRVLRKPCRA